MHTGRPIAALTTAAPAERFLAPQTIAAAAVPAEAEGQVKSWVQLLKTGKFVHKQYGEFTVDRQFLSALASNFASFPQGVPGDYDHSFLTKGDTRAVGWITQVDVRGDELWGEVAWTASAAEAIRNAEYRFISPEFAFDWVNESGVSKGPALLAFGLTNRPFLEGMREVSLAQSADGGHILLMNPRSGATTDDKETTVDREKLIEALGLSADATDEQIVAAAQTRQANPEGAVVLTSDEHAALQKRAEDGDAAARKAAESVKATHLSTWKQTGRMAPADEEMVALAYDQDAEKVIAAMESKQPSKAFASKGGDGGTDDDDDDLTRPQKVDKRARALMADRDCTYGEALRLADAEVPREHPALS